MSQSIQVIQAGSSLQSRPLQQVSAYVSTHKEESQRALGRADPQTHPQELTQHILQAGFLWPKLSTASALSFQPTFV